MTQHPSELSPAQWPPKVGELAITLSNPRGYCVILLSTTETTAQVKYLDAPEGTFTCALLDLIATGKTPDDIIAQYTLDPVALDNAIDLELSMPDLTYFTKTKSSSTKSTKPKKTSINALAKALLAIKPDQLKAIKSLLGV